MKLPELDRRSWPFLLGTLVGALWLGLQLPILGMMLTMLIGAGLTLIYWQDCEEKKQQAFFAEIARLFEEHRDFDLDSASLAQLSPATKEILQLVARRQKMHEKRTLQLADSKREEGWRVMAQQIAHEINNCLTPLRLNTQYLTLVLQRSDDESLSGAERMAGHMLERIDHLSAVANEFKVFANLDSPVLEQIALSGFVRDYVQNYDASKHSEAGVRLIYVDNPQLRSAMVEVDVRHLLRVLNHLVRNAMQAIPEDRLGQVTLSLKPAPGGLAVVVRDNGRGIAQELQSTLFEPRFCTSSSQTGLGLSVSKRIVACFGGSLKYSTIQGIGTTFALELPVAGMMPVGEDAIDMVA